MTDTISIRITKIWIINSRTINSIINSISRQRKIIIQTAIIIISVTRINQTTILIFSLSEQSKITFNWTSKRSINRSAIQQMRIINKIILSEKITTINLTKIIHRVIISISFRVFHIVIIIIVLIIINLASRSFIASSLLFYINWINQINWSNANRKRARKKACKSR